MFNLLEIDFKVTIIHMLKKLKKIMCKELKESMRMISHQTENINKVIEMIKETQIEFLEIENSISEIKNSVGVECGVKVGVQLFIWKIIQ